MGLIISFLSGTLGRFVLGGGALLLAWLWVKTHYEGKGAAKEKSKIERRAKKNVRKAKKIRREVQKLPAESLFDRFFRD